MNNKLQLIETPDYILAVSDKDIKEGDWVLNTSNNKVFKQDNDKPDAYTLSFWKKIIGYQPKNNAAELDLLLLPDMIVENHILEDRIYCVDVQNYEFDTAPQTWCDEKFMSEAEIQGNVYSMEGFVKAFNKTEINQDNLIIRFMKAEIVVEDDVEKLASFYYGENRSTREFEEGFRKGFKIGYKAATKTFSEEDLRKAFEAGMYFIGEDKGSYEEFIQSLKQSKTPKWFVAEMEEESGFTPNGYYSKIVLKTTTINSKTYLVGHYE
jgi:hypothetical protein